MPTELDFAERRALGVLIEKGFTTPDQYPLTLNGVIVGCNQKSCRDPVASLDEEAVLESLDSLRQKGYAILVRMEGSRADRWKHRAGDVLGLEPPDLAIVAELLLRGPQTDGELRQRAGRMIPVGDLKDVNRRISELASREDALLRRVSPPARKRGVRYAHTFYPAAESPGDAEESTAGGAADAAEAADLAGAAERFPTAEFASGVAPVPAAATVPAAAASFAPASGADANADLVQRIRALEERVEELEATFVKFLR